MDFVLQYGQFPVDDYVYTFKVAHISNSLLTLLTLTISVRTERLPNFFQSPTTPTVALCVALLYNLLLARYPFLLLVVV